MWPHQNNHNEQPTVRDCAIEFVGGPLDGFHCRLACDPSRFGDVIAMPVNRNVIRSLCGEEPGQREAATSAAIYVLSEEASGRRYLFFGPSPVDRFEFESWAG
jgi:hypothetical protein